MSAAQHIGLARGVSPRHAIVLGGSVSGLFAARVLSEHFESVTLFDRDVLPNDDSLRKGAPQGAHFHSFALRGERLAERWFPGFSAALRARGAIGVEMGPDFRWFHFGGFKTGRPSGLELTCMTRPALEAEVRQRVAALPNVQLVDRTNVVGLVGAATGIRGVTIKRRADGERGEVVDADLVVDATGRGSQTPRWLEALGFSRPAESIVKVDVCYATRFFRRPPGGKHPWKVLFVVGESPASRRLGIVAPVEGDRWIALLVGLLGDHPPPDDDGWMAFARSLPNPELAEALSAAEPLSSAVLYKFSSHQRRHYERMKDFPGGLIVLGDAHCSFNPIYGQGMTSAALAVDALEGELSRSRSLDGFSRRAQRAIARTANGPWMMATGEDLRHPAVAGDRPMGASLVNAYMARFMRATRRDPELTSLLYRVVHMLVPPTALMRPSVALRVLRYGAEQA